MPGIAGVVILYHPDQGLPQRISTYLPHLDQLYVIDNSEESSRLMNQYPKIHYIAEGINQGIAARINQAAALSIQAGYEFLLTLDQDSYFEGDMLKQYLHCIQQFPGTEQAAMFGVQFTNRNEASANCQPEEALDLITSGSIINLKHFFTVGGYDEKLFIDQADYDFSFRCKLAGFRVVRMKNIFMQHSLGNESEHFSFKTFRKTKRSLHSPVRIYYMARNYLYMKKLYGDRFPKEILHMKKDLRYRLKNNFLYHPEKLGMVQYLWRAYRDFKAGRMGKLGGH